MIYHKYICDFCGDTRERDQLLTARVKREISRDDEIPGEKHMRELLDITGSIPSKEVNEVIMKHRIEDIKKQNNMNLENLKKIALAATPGEWKYEPAKSRHDDPCVTCNGKWICATSYDTLSTSQEHNVEEDAEFIAAANPQTILALIDRLERAEGIK